MYRPLRCPSCGTTTDEGSDFTATRRQTIEQSFVVADTRYDGTVELTPVDFHVVGSAAAVTFTCDSCGYSWLTQRPIAVQEPL